MRSYRSQFSAQVRKSVVKKLGTIFVDHCAIRIKQVCPKAKFVLMIRDPIKRAYSAWNMNRNRNTEMSPFDVCVDRNLANLDEYGVMAQQVPVCTEGFYMDQIKRWLGVFPDRNQLLVVIAEHLRGEGAKKVQ